MTQAGLNLKAIQKVNRLECKRSETILLVKNISQDIGVSELKDIFARYGPVERCLISPSGTLGLIEY